MWNPQLTVYCYNFSVTYTMTNLHVCAKNSVNTGNVPEVDKLHKKEHKTHVCKENSILNVTQMSIKLLTR